MTRALAVLTGLAAGCTVRSELIPPDSCDVRDRPVAIGPNADPGLGFSPQELATAVAGEYRLRVRYQNPAGEVDAFHALGRAEEEWSLRLGDEVSNVSFRDRPPSGWPNGVCPQGPLYRMEVPMVLNRMDPPGLRFESTVLLEGEGLRPRDLYLAGESFRPWGGAPGGLEGEFAQVMQLTTPLDVGLFFGYGRLDWNHPEYDLGGWAPPSLTVIVWDEEDRRQVLFWGYWEWLDAPR